ncbi:MAG: zinc ribbon domain-containing protein [Chloroflexi bacterium]|nr:zinc ribbon domain-containing protein [Chloroflexota bacterium]
MGTRRTLGYVENQWTCPNCGTRNRGSVKTCENCGAPQPENVKFELPPEQKFITEEEKVKAAQSGADIHCGFCGTRNPATAVTCSQCGADLKEGKAREAGQVMTAPPPPPRMIRCGNCGTENPGSQSTCSNCGAALPKAQAAAPSGPMGGTLKPAAPKKTNWLLIGGILAFFAVCCVAGLFLFLFPSRSVQATVTDVYWQTVVPVQEIRPINYTDERGNPPSDAYNVSCYDDSREVCEQKTIDKGNGYSEVVEECHTETEQYCSYTVDEWTTIQTYTLEGNDLQPVYDSPNLASDQRLGDKSETLTVYFLTEDGAQESYTAGSVSEFQQFTPGSTWTLKLNTLGGIVSVEP